MLTFDHLSSFRNWLVLVLWIWSNFYGSLAWGSFELHFKRLIHILSIESFSFCELMKNVIERIIAKLVCVSSLFLGIGSFWSYKCHCWCRARDKFTFLLCDLKLAFTDLRVLIRARPQRFSLFAKCKCFPWSFLRSINFIPQLAFRIWFWL